MKYKGKIEGYPKEIVDKMLQHQKEQTGRVGLKTLEGFGPQGAFVFGATPEGHDFWADIIRSNNFDTFFKRYPKPINISKSIDEISKIISEL